MELKTSEATTLCATPGIIAEMVKSRQIERYGKCATPGIIAEMAKSRQIERYGKPQVLEYTAILHELWSEQY